MFRNPLCAFATVCTIACVGDVGVAADPHHCVAGQHAPPATSGNGVALVSGYVDDSEQYAPFMERWCLGIKDCIRATRLRGYKRMQKKHRGLLYPEAPPYCSPTYGYHTTRWRQFPEHCEYIESYVPGQVIYQLPGQAQPMAMPLAPTPDDAPARAAPALAPPAAEPYFPAPNPIIQPAEPGPAPAAPSADPTAPPAPPEPDLDPAGAIFLPSRPLDAGPALPTSFEEPGRLPVN